MGKIRSVFDRLEAFFDDLRKAGIPFGLAQTQDCCRSLLLIDWSDEPIFHSALATTLVKDGTLLPIFNDIYKLHFKDHNIVLNNCRDCLWDSTFQSDNRLQMYTDQHQREESIPGFQSSKNSAVKTGIPTRSKSLLLQDFDQVSFEDLKRMEAFIPSLAKRLAAKLVTKTRKNQADRLDYRKTVRASLSTGGILANLYAKRKKKEKPVIVALSDVSDSCLHFSFFALTLMHSLERFYRQVKSFGFVDRADDITLLLKSADLSSMRRDVLFKSGVVENGYTDYGASFQSFLSKYGSFLTFKSTVLILGDARTNWFPSRPELLKEIRSRVKRIYWFMPEPLDRWNRGDCSISIYKKYCDGVFECTNLEQLAQAIYKIQP
ncbi:MAG: VWA domain-containing protein [Chitinophagales bacterium]